MPEPGTGAGAVVSSLWVVVPAYNEERALPATLAALAAQVDRDFTLVVVDNGSTDGTARVVDRFAASAPGFAVHGIQEARKGTGAAADTGVRFAIAHGASHVARTDADCLPRRDWTAGVRHAFDVQRLRFVAGRIVPRRDEGLSLRERVLLPLLVAVAERYGRYARRGPGFKYPYFMAAGNNLAIEATLYLEAGGFPRTAVEEAHEDRELSERVRRLTTQAAVRRDLVVENSVRRVRAYGMLNVLRWYRNHGYRPAVVDIR